MSEPEAPFLIISSSLNPSSRSRILANAVRHDLESAGEPVDWVDLAEVELPLCDGGAAYGHENVSILTERILAARGILVATPIYNYTINAALKNLIELTGRNWTGKVVGFACAAGGQSSYMAVLPVANSLMVDFRCVIIPRFVYATGQHFEGPEISDSDLRARVSRLSSDLVQFSNALFGLTEQAPVE
ncbi:MAG: NAD(P)H-dependent oxidoreductase [Verrucomicrobiota bacterium]